MKHETKIKSVTLNSKPLFIKENMNDGNKEIDEFLYETGKQFIAVFNALDLKIHIEATYVYNGQVFELSFRKV